MVDKNYQDDPTVCHRLKPLLPDLNKFVLVDLNRHIRGYYDARYIAEVKRLIDEYQHLRIKEEKQLLIEKNEIKQNP